MPIASAVSERLFLVDAQMLGMPRYGGLYILKAPRPAIIETGFSHTLDRTLQALAELGIRREDVAYIMPTHVHMDHAGGAGFLAEACPNAQVVVHEQGAEHLIEPTKLLQSVERAVGPLFSYYGTLKPTPRDRVTKVRGGETFDLGGGTVIEVLDAPGHAPHQACFYERKTRGLFTADAVGIYRPWAAGLLLTTPPPRFDLAQSLQTLQMLKTLSIRHLHFTHYGSHDDLSLMDRYAESLQRWTAEVQEVKARLGDDVAVKQELVRREYPRLQQHYSAQIIAGEVAMNAQGILLYLQRKNRSPS